MTHNIKKVVSLKNYNTFGIEVLADELIEIQSIEDLKDAINYIKETQKSFFILNGGSNILFTKNVNETVLHIQTKGIQIIEETDKQVLIEVQAGENWHNFVQYCLQNNWGGLENLSLIPGNVGTSPMQNIGAYGVEIKDCFHQLTAYEIETNTLKIFNLAECQFGYRESYFKQAGKGKYIITSVQFRLQKPPHTISSQYGIINDVLEKNKCYKPTIQDISRAVIEIRESKLPNPKELGNAGSFFKNPIVPKNTLTSIQSSYPEIPFYKIDDLTVKIPAGWLIETAGWKGKKIGNCGVHTKQALVLVNYGEATGMEIFMLSTQIIKDIEEKFNITLEREVNIY